MANIHHAAKALGESLTLLPPEVRARAISAAGDILMALRFNEAAWAELFNHSAMEDIKAVMMPHFKALCIDLPLGQINKDDIIPALIEGVPDLKAVMSGGGGTVDVAALDAMAEEPTEPIEPTPVAEVVTTVP